MGNAEMQNRYGLGALQGAGDIYGQMMSNTNPYFDAMTQMMAGIPQSQYMAGKMKLNAPLDWANSSLGTLLQVANAGAPTSTGVGGGSADGSADRGERWGSMFGGMVEDWLKPPETTPGKP